MQRCHCRLHRRDSIASSTSSPHRLCSRHVAECARKDRRNANGSAAFAFGSAVQPVQRLQGACTTITTRTAARAIAHLPLHLARSARHCTSAICHRIQGKACQLSLPHATMPRNRVCDVGFTAQVRVASTARHTPPDASSTLLALDAACRRASSIKAFALRLEAAPERGEAWLAAVHAAAGTH